MKKIALFLILLALVSGCLEKKVVKEVKYVCPDESVVSKPEDCPEVEEKPPEKITITKYVCPDGGVVEGAEECELVVTSTSTTTLLGTTTTSIVTTTLEGTSTSTTSTSTTTITTTSTSTTSTTTTIQEGNSCVELGCPEGTQFVGSKNSDKYHYCDCRYAKRIDSENLVCFSSEEEAQSEGYVPCGVCEPPE